MDELELNIIRLSDRHGIGVDGAAHWLLAHPDEAHPRLLETLERNEGNVPIILALLSRFGRPESVPRIAEYLTKGTQTLAHAAAGALAEHPAIEARKALEDALPSPRPETTIAAADALCIRGDTASCPALRDQLERDDSFVRYHVLQAAGRLGCLDREVLLQISQCDEDRDIRALAKCLLGG